jgi:hypothetical protein
VWDVAAGKVLPLAGRTREALDVALSPDGTELATTRGSGVVLLWEVEAPRGRD